MHLKYPGYFILLLAGISMNSCKKLVEINPPTDQLVTASVFNNDNTAIAAQLGVYAEMQNILWQIDNFAALSADEFTNYSTSVTAKDLYANALNASNDGNNLFWQNAYIDIYPENAMIENVQTSAGITSKTKKLLTGEAAFIRAFWYFYVVNFYGDAPIVTTTNYKVNSVLSRSPQEMVYRQIIQDLKDAKNLLSDEYLDATDTVTTVERARPTTWAASALLARTYLYTKKYDSAEMEATNVINNTSLFGLPGLDSVFLANSKEAIWQIIPPSTHKWTFEGDNFILIAPPGGSGVRSTAISPQLLNAFETGDNRKINWIHSYTKDTSTWYYPYKYKDNSTATSLREYSMVLRLGEQYLIRAEARAQQNKLADAISDIDAIRVRAGLAGLSGTLNQTQVLAAVAQERQVELFTEAHRWMDLKRTNTVDSVMSIVTLQKKGSWNSNQQWYPLPVTDLENDINLTQNQGY